MNMEDTAALWSGETIWKAEPNVVIRPKSMNKDDGIGNELRDQHPSRFAEFIHQKVFIEHLLWANPVGLCSWNTGKLDMDD